MKLLSGDPNRLVEETKKKLVERLQQLKDQVESERTEQLERSKKQAQEARELVLRGATARADAVRRERLLAAKREANRLLLEEQGKYEAEIRQLVRDELRKFIRGERDIDGLRYSNLVSELKKQMEKRGEVTVKKTEDGQVLVGKDLQLDLTLGSLEEKIKVVSA